jgi:hypothetical protein
MTDTDPIIHQPESCSKLPVRATVIAALRLIKAEWKDILRILLFPCLLLAVLGAGIQQATENIPTHPYNLFYGLVNFVVLPWLATTLLRFLIKNERPAGWLPRYQPLMWKFVWKQFLIGLAVVVPSAVVALLLIKLLPGIPAILIGIIIAAVAAFFGTRLALAAPAAALGADSQLRTAWNMTRGQALRILSVKFLCVVFAILPFILVIILVTAVAAIAPIFGSVIALCAVTIIQLLVLQIPDALLFGHFYAQQQGSDHDQ